MPRQLRILLLMAVFWAQPASADERPPYMVYVSFGANNLAERAREYLSERLTTFSRWLQAPARLGAFPGFEVRGTPASGVSLGNPRILAIVDGRFGGQEQNEANARINIGNSRLLTLLANPASRFEPIRGVVRLGASGNLRTSMGMYETIIQYSLLVRAFEGGDRQLFGYVSNHLQATIQRTRGELGTTLSFRCLRQIEENIQRMAAAVSWSPALRASAVQQPQKDLQC